MFGEPNEFQGASHHECRLGKWYEAGVGKESFSKTPSYAKLSEPHRIVHGYANCLAKECGNKSSMCSKKEIEEMVGHIEHASKEVFALLDAMVEEKADKTMLKAKSTLFKERK